MDFRKRRKWERRRAIAASKVSQLHEQAGLKQPGRLPPKYRSNGPLAERLTRLSRRIDPNFIPPEKYRGAGRSKSFVYARLSKDIDFDLVENSRRRATWSQRLVWRERVQKATPEEVARRNDMETCKERPHDSRKGRGGGRSFIPWCR